jgi:hypothetical protein
MAHVAAGTTRPFRNNREYFPSHDTQRPPRAASVLLRGIRPQLRQNFRQFCHLGRQR